MKRVNYVFVEKGYQMSLYWCGTENEFNKELNEYDKAFANCTIKEYSFKSQEDVEKFIEAYNKFLEASWKPNQDEATREINAKIMDQCTELMNSLHI